MKTGALLRHPRRHGCYLKREGAGHAIWTNPLTGHSEAVPRHVEIPNLLARKICRALLVPEDRTVNGHRRDLVPARASARPRAGFRSRLSQEGESSH